MKTFSAGLLFLAMILVACVSLFAQENPPSVQIPLEVIVNQAVESGAEDPMDEWIPGIELEPEFIKHDEMMPTGVNAEILPDNHVDVEVAPMTSGESSIKITDHVAFNRIKQLAGRWEGVGKNGSGEKQDKIVVAYEVTAGGSAVLERIFPDSPQEMITVYYEEKNRLHLTHFCMIGTRSLMALDHPQGNVYEFSLLESPALDPAVDTHMHSLKISFIDENHMNQEWTMFEAGKPSGDYSFMLTRIIPSP
ncbi:MAG: hypothetical protein H6754_06145 [Candidatus Omnitrophica bacterium]|nr:hypothetical protein [Candidatus Omnitrophota bacterium]